MACAVQLDLATRRLRVLGKGQKKRTVPFSPSLAATLDEYVNSVRPTLRGAKSPFLFVNPRSERKGSNAGKYGEKTINRITKRLGDAAGVPGRHYRTSGGTPTPPDSSATARTFT
jgi:site-specific recombinase XerD